jgi:hypothetical protein
MRMIFGLVGLLVTFGIIMILVGMQLDQDTGTIKAGMNAQQQVKQIGGRDPDGVPISQTFSVSPVMRGSNLEALLVDKIDPGGAMQQKFGLMAGDEIVALAYRGTDEPVRLRDLPGGESMADSYVIEAYQFDKPMVIRRAGQEIPVTPVAVAPTPPKPTKAPNDTGIEDTLKALQQVQ